MNPPFTEPRPLPFPMIRPDLEPRFALFLSQRAAAVLPDHFGAVAGLLGDKANVLLFRQHAGCRTSAARGPRGRTSIPRSKGLAEELAEPVEEGLDDHSVGNVDEETADQRHDDEGLVGGTVAFAHRGHVGHRGGRRTERDAAES